MPQSGAETDDKEADGESFSPREAVGRIEKLWTELVAAEDGGTGMAKRRQDLLAAVGDLEQAARRAGADRIARLTAPLLVLLGGLGKKRSPDNADRWGQAAILIEGLDEAAQSPAAPARRGIKGGADFVPNILIVGRTEDEISALSRKIDQFGYRARSARGGKEGLRQLADRWPDLVILDAAESPMGGKFLRAFGAMKQPPPLVAISGVDSFETRLAAARAGCNAFLVRPGDLEDLIDWIDRLTGSVPDEPAYILIVGGDPFLAETYSVMLEGEGMTAGVLEAPERIFESLEEELPDVILIDLYMPTLSGFDFARVVRQSKRYLGISIVFLSSDEETAEMRHLLNLSGDDFLSIPITPDELILAVSVRAQRARALQSLMDRDSLTGLLNHRRIREELEQEVARAERAGHPVSLALLDLDRFKRVNDKYGHLAGDTVLWSLARLLGKRLRRSDMVGRYGGEEFAVVFTDTETNTAFYVTDEIRQAFADTPREMDGDIVHITLSAGIAGWSPGMSAADMIEAADQCLYRAKEEGRNRVVTDES